MFSEPVNFAVEGSAFKGDQSLSRDFWNPFLLPSSREMPQNFRNVFDLCLYLWLSNPEYQQAHIKTTGHFLTELEFPDKTGDREEKEEFRDFLDNDLRVFDVAHTAGCEFGAYGNVLLRMYLPFNRFLIDERRGPDNRAEWSLQAFPESEVKYHASDLQYEVPDPVTAHLPASKRKRVKFFFCDRRAMDMKRIKLHLIDPRWVHIKHSLWSGRNQYVVQLDPDFVSQIKQGLLWQVNETPLWVLEAVKTDSCVQFSDNEVFHMKAPTISGISTGGWGLPEVVSNFRNLHATAVHRKINEAVGRDYVLPMRIFSPSTSGSMTDALNTSHLGEWKAAAAEMIRAHRKDPFSMHAYPFPMTIQQAGGDGMSLVPRDNMRFQIDTMLDGAGYPSELFHSTLSYQQTPIALRNFEQSKRHHGRGLSDLISWAADRVNDFMGRARIPTRLARPTVVDDLERRSMFLQLAAGGEFPRAVAYRGFNAGDPVEAAKQRAIEDKEIAKAVEEIQLEYQREKTIGSLSDQVNSGLGQAPGGVQYTPMDRQSKVLEEATRLLNIPDDGARAKELANLRGADADMYALVSQKMKELRAQAESQGRAQAGQIAAQQQQQGGA